MSYKISEILNKLNELNIKINKYTDNNINTEELYKNVDMKVWLKVDEKLKDVNMLLHNNIENVVLNKIKNIQSYVDNAWVNNRNELLWLINNMWYDLTMLKNKSQQQIQH